MYFVFLKVKSDDQYVIPCTFSLPNLPYNVHPRVSLESISPSPPRDGFGLSKNLTRKSGSLVFIFMRFMLLLTILFFPFCALQRFHLECGTATHAHRDTGLFTDTGDEGARRARSRMLLAGSPMCPCCAKTCRRVNCDRVSGIGGGWWL